MESNLNISILGYIIGSVLTKSVVIFGTGAILTALCIWTDRMFFPYLAGMLLYGGSYLLYLLIPTVGKGSLFKYINLIGLMKTENLYGSYLNFDMGGHPISRLLVSWSIIILLVAPVSYTHLDVYKRQVWGYDAEGDCNVVKEHVRKIRAKLNEVTGQDYIETIWGVGYKWKRQ